MQMKPDITQRVQRENEKPRWLIRPSWFSYYSSMSTMRYIARAIIHSTLNRSGGHMQIRAWMLRKQVCPYVPNKKNNNSIVNFSENFPISILLFVFFGQK